MFSAGINVSGGTIAGTLATATQSNITSLGDLTSLTVTSGEIALGNAASAGGWSVSIGNMAGNSGQGVQAVAIGRNAGETGYTYRKMIRLALDAITSFSNWPLRLATLSGFFCAFVGFFLILYTLYARFILKQYEPGWPSLMITIIFLGGIQLMGIGMIGEYISRIIDNVKNRPLYLVGETNIGPDASN